jgi:hypothetical protein
MSNITREGIEFAAGLFPEVIASDVNPNEHFEFLQDDSEQYVDQPRLAFQLGEPGGSGRD